MVIIVKHSIFPLPYNRSYKNKRRQISFIRLVILLRQGLTEYMLKNAPIKNKKYTLSDGRGLLLEVNPNGSKYWIVRIYENRREYRRSLGTYPEVNLKVARAKAFELKNARNYKINVDKTTFADVYKLFYEKRLKKLSDSYQRTVKLRWEKYIEPEFGKLRIVDITPNNVLRLCQDIIEKGYIDTSHRIRMLISQVFEFAIVEDIISVNPAASISRAKLLKTHMQLNYAAITEPAQIGLLMRSIEEYPHIIVKIAMKLSAHCFCRPGEIRKAEWSEISFENNLWVIPSEKMKKRRDHIVPLSKQVIRMLEDLKKETGSSKWLFPSARGDGRPMSDGTVRIALRSMGYPKEQMTAHGFRSMASTILNFYEWPKDIVESQLAHIDTTVRGVYNRSLYLPQRKIMMQWWSDTLDALQNNKKVPKKPKNLLSISDK